VVDDGAVSEKGASMRERVAMGHEGIPPSLPARIKSKLKIRPAGIKINVNPSIKAGRNPRALICPGTSFGEEFRGLAIRRPDGPVAGLRT
jgi:hypothetical protein